VAARGHGAGTALPEGTDERFASASVPHHFAPLIGERAATHGRGATEGGVTTPV